MTRLLPRRLAALSLSAAVLACGDSPKGDAIETGGTLVIAAAGEAEHLFPPLVAFLSSKQIVDQLYDFLADVGPSVQTVGDGGFRPGLASGWTWNGDSSVVTFQLNPAAAWHDGNPVRAADVTFTYALYTNPALESPVVSSFPAIDSVTSPDSLSVAVYFSDKSPERFYRLVYNMQVLPKHLLEGTEPAAIKDSPFIRAPVGSGPFKFVKWNAGTSIELAANEAYAGGRPVLDRVIWRTVADANTALSSVMAGETDMLELLRPDGVTSASGNDAVRIVEYPSMMNGFLLFNTRNPNRRAAPHPVLGDVAARRALAMAIDRASVVGNAFDSLAVLSNGPFVRMQWTADTTVSPPPFDVSAAQALLDSAGWRDSNGDGIRERNGVRLSLRILVPSVSNSRRQMAVVLQDQWRRVGVDAQVDVVEPSALLPQLTQGKFDTFIHLAHNDPTPSGIGQAWGSQDLARSMNYGWYSNQSVDSMISAAALMTDPAATRAAYRRIYQTIDDDAAAVFLWEPRNFALINARFDVPTLRGDAWWAGLESWSVRPGMKNARDAIASR